MTIKLKSEEDVVNSKFYYFNQDITYNYQIDMIDNGINIWYTNKNKQQQLGTPFIFESFQITNEDDILKFRKYVKSIPIGCYTAILITGNLPFTNKKLTKTLKLIGGSNLIEQLSDSNPNFVLVGYRAQKSGYAREAIGDCDNEDDGISVWIMTNKSRWTFKNRLSINIRNKIPLYSNISNFYKKHIKKEMTSNVYL